MNPEIVAAAWRAAREDISIPSKPWMCLSLARRIVEAAHFNGEYAFYSKYLVKRTSMARARNKDGSADMTPYASDIEASMKALGFVIHKDNRQAGDLVFNWQAAKPFGHVGVLLDRDTVIENVKPSFRPQSVNLWRPNGSPLYIALTPLSQFNVTTFARLQKR